MPTFTVQRSRKDVLSAISTFETYPCRFILSQDLIYDLFTYPLLGLSIYKSVQDV